MTIFWGNKKYNKEINPQINTDEEPERIKRQLKNGIQVEYPRTPDMKPEKVNIITQIFLPIRKTWNWLNGKKRTLGALGSLITGVMMLAGVTGAPLIIAGSISLLLDGTGILHYGLKEQTLVGSKGEFGENELKELIQMIVDFLMKVFKLKK